MTIRMGIKEAQLRLASAQGQYEQATRVAMDADKAMYAAYALLLVAEAALAQAEAPIATEPCPHGCSCGFPLELE